MEVPDIFYTIQLDNNFKFTYVLTSFSLLKSSSVLTSSGANSSNIDIHWQKMGTVVIKTNIANMNVVIGSAIFQSGLK